MDGRRLAKDKVNIRVGSGALVATKADILIVYFYGYVMDLNN